MPLIPSDVDARRAKRMAMLRAIAEASDHESVVSLLKETDAFIKDNRAIFRKNLFDTIGNVLGVTLTLGAAGVEAAHYQQALGTFGFLVLAIISAGNLEKKKVKNIANLNEAGALNFLNETLQAQKKELEESFRLLHSEKTTKISGGKIVDSVVRNR